ncbi:MAG TPA: ABC transporter permease [Burkholderiaceae bacterium]|nr:ABC transporter permease [Burkholderiaceae bacterium]
MNLLDATVDALRLLVFGDAALWRIVLTSLKVSIAGLVLAAPFAILTGYAVAVGRFPGKRVAVLLLQTALSIPTVVVGLVLYMLLSRSGPWGQFELLFTTSGMAIGQALLAFPVLAAFTLSAVQATDPRAWETAVALGANRALVMMTVLHEARFAVMAAVVNGFGRAISEVGAALMIGGNIAEHTRTMTTAIALETSKGEFAQGIALGIVLVLVALAVNVALAVLQGRGGLR